MFDLDVDAILNKLANLESTVLASAVLARRQTPLTERPVREVGQQLFQALFGRKVYGTYPASLGAAQQSGRQLRLVPRRGSPQLAAMPWETLFDVPDGAVAAPRPGAGLPSKPAGGRAAAADPWCVASPRGLPARDVGADKEHLARAMARTGAAGRIELVWAQHATWNEVHEQLLRTS